MNSNTISFGLLIAGFCLQGCAAPRGGLDEAKKQAMLELLMPSRVEIVEPFTRARSFDGDDRPDGIELLLQASNALDSPGLMITGQIRVEVYEFLPATGDHKGRRLEQWDIELAGKDQQQRYWNQVTQMYEFRLGLDVEKVPLAEQYVLAVTYASPLGTRLEDDCVIRFRPGAEPARSARAGAQRRGSR